MGGLGIDFIAAHTGIWLSWPVIVAIIIFAAIVIYFILRRRKMVKTEKELEDLLEEKYEREGAEADSEGVEEETSDPDSYDAGE